MSIDPSYEHLLLVADNTDYYEQRDTNDFAGQWWPMFLNAFAGQPNIIRSVMSLPDIIAKAFAIQQYLAARGMQQQWLALYVAMRNTYAELNTCANPFAVSVSVIDAINSSDGYVPYDIMDAYLHAVNNYQ